MHVNLQRGATKSKIRKQVNRLRIFGFIKSHMERHGTCPSSLMVAEELRMSQNLVATHMRALEDATGLPLPIPSGAIRKSIAAIETNGRLEKYTAALTAQATKGGNYVNPMSPVPVDVLMGAMR